MVLYSSVVTATVNLITPPDDPPPKKSAYVPGFQVLQFAHFHVIELFAVKKRNFTTF